MSEIEPENVFSYLSDDVVLNIFFKLVDDPRDWSRLACVCTKFSSLIRTICWKTKCHQAIPAVVSDLIPANSSAVGGWASLHKLAVCCPGLVHSGVLLENSDFGLERDLGPDENYPISESNPSCSSTVDDDKINGVKPNLFQSSRSESNPSCSTALDDKINGVKPNFNGSDCSWSLYDDLYLDTVYNNSSKSQDQSDVRNENPNPNPDPDPKHNSSSSSSSSFTSTAIDVIKQASDFSICKKRKICRSLTSHLASEAWNFSREQGNKLLASRFRGDCLYICDWPGCVHTEEKRNYMLFRGVFKNFKRSRVWRTINDGNRRSKIDLNCAFCPSDEVWELHSAFCLRPAYGFHDDGEPVVRAYVCENGHVSGAWTDWPLYT